MGEEWEGLWVDGFKSDNGYGEGRLNVGVGCWMVCERIGVEWFWRVRSG